MTGGPTVTGRVADVLAVFGPNGPERTLSSIARDAGLPLTTAHRIVGELTRTGLLERGDDARYRVGLRLWEIAATAPRPLDLREIAGPFLGDLYEATHENVQLAMLDRGEALYLDRIAGRQSVHAVTRTATRLPLHATGVGLVLLAHAEHELREQVLGRPLRRYTRHTVTDPRRVRRVLADVRRDGYAVSDRQIETISTSVAAPVRDARGTVVAAVSIVAAAGPGRATSFVAAVVAAAHGISRGLGEPGRSGG